jgi:hypothetical protein
MRIFEAHAGCRFAKHREFLQVISIVGNKQPSAWGQIRTLDSKRLSQLQI